MSFDPNKRLRFGGSKSRNGCLTCIARHLKCDEGQPSCQKCIKAGRVCKQRKASVENLRMVHYHSGPAVSLSIQPEAELIERRHFDFFRTRTAPELSGVHYKERWLTHLFKLTYSEPAVYHAAAAVGALHEHFEQGISLPQPMSPMLQQPLRQYTKAINKLMETMSNPNTANQDTALLACIMFCAFESMSYHLHSALSHIHSGLKILAERATRDRSEHDTVVPCTDVNAMFSRLNVQLLELGDPSFDVTNIRLFDGPVSPTVFSGIPEAQRFFNPLLNMMLHKIHTVGHRGVDLTAPDAEEHLSVKEWIQEEVEDFEKWNDRFDDVLSRSVSTASKQDVCSMLVLEMRRTIMVLMLRIDLKQGEMGFDQHLETFRLVVELAEEFLYHASVPGSSNSTPAADVIKSDPEDARATISAAEKLKQVGVGSKNIQSGFLVVHPSQTPLVDHSLCSSARLQTSATALIERARELRTREDGSIYMLPEHFKPIFSMSHGVLYPLYTTATRCRDPAVRRSALTLLQRCNRREGLWDSELSARLAKNVIDIEEGRTLQLLHDAAAATWIAMDEIEIMQAGDIPNAARVRVIRPSFLPERKSIERYYFSWRGRFEDAAHTEETWVEETMTW